MSLSRRENVFRTKNTRTDTKPRLSRFIPSVSRNHFAAFAFVHQITSSHGIEFILSFVLIMSCFAFTPRASVSRRTSTPRDLRILSKTLCTPLEWAGQTQFRRESIVKLTRFGSPLPDFLISFSILRCIHNVSSTPPAPAPTVTIRNGFFEAKTRLSIVFHLAEKLEIGFTGVSGTLSSEDSTACGVDPTLIESTS